MSKKHKKNTVQKQYANKVSDQQSGATLKDLLNADTLKALQAKASQVKESARKQEELEQARKLEERKKEQQKLENDFAYLLENSDPRLGKYN